MAYALVGSVGAVTQGTSGGSVSPAWDAGAPRTAGDLLICTVVGDGSATGPSTPSGWTVARSAAGTSCAVTIYSRIATGSDAAPTINGVTNSVLAAQLMEFSGNSNTAVPEHAGSASGTSSPLNVTGGTDNFAGDLLVCSTAIFYSVAATATLSDSLNNGASANTTNSAALNTVNHYDFCWGVTNSKAVADKNTFTYTTTNITGAVGAIASFSQPTGGIPRIRVQNQAVAQSATW